MIQGENSVRAPSFSLASDRFENPLATSTLKALKLRPGIILFALCLPSALYLCPLPPWFFSVPPWFKALSSLPSPFKNSGIRNPHSAMGSWFPIRPFFCSDSLSDLTFQRPNALNTPKIMLALKTLLYYPTYMIRKSHSWSLAWTRGKSADHSGPSIGSLSSGQPQARQSAWKPHNPGADCISPYESRISYFSLCPVRRSHSVRDNSHSVRNRSQSFATFSPPSPHSTLRRVVRTPPSRTSKAKKIRRPNLRSLRFLLLKIPQSRPLRRVVRVQPPFMNVQPSFMNRT